MLFWQYTIPLVYKYMSKIIDMSLIWLIFLFFFVNSHLCQHQFSNGILSFRLHVRTWGKKIKNKKERERESMTERTSERGRERKREGERKGKRSGTYRHRGNCRKREIKKDRKKKRGREIREREREYIKKVNIQRR